MTKKGIVVVDPTKMEWETIERALRRLGRGQEVARAPEAVRGAWVKVLSYDEETRAMAGLVKFDEGYHESKHSHPSDSHFMVLEGKLVDEKGDDIEGGMYCYTPAGVEHGPYEAPEGCVLFVSLNGPAW